MLEEEAESDSRTVSDLEWVYLENISNLLFEWHADVTAFLSFTEQAFLLKKIERIGLHRLPNEDDRSRYAASQYFRAEPDERARIQTIIAQGGEADLNTPDRMMYQTYREYQALSEEERRRIDADINRLGIDGLPSDQRDLYVRYEHNKFRRQWFTAVCGWVLLIVDCDGIDQRMGRLLSGKTKRLVEKIGGQSLNTKRDVKRGEQYLYNALFLLKPFLRGCSLPEIKSWIDEALSQHRALQERPTPS